MDELGSWTAEHFSLANPEGEGQADVPRLLRRVADVIEGSGAVEIQDLVLHTDINEFGDWPSITVYFQKQKTLLYEEKTSYRCQKYSRS